MARGNKNAVKKHVKKVLKDPKRRSTYFKASGALGDEKEGRSPHELMEVELNNQDVNLALSHKKSEAVDQKMDDLKSGKKIVLTR